MHRCALSHGQLISPPSHARHDLRGVLSLHFRHTLSGWGCGNADVVVNCRAPDSVLHPSLTVLRGHEQLRALVAPYGQHYADTRVDMHGAIYSGDFLAIHQT